MTTIHTWWPTLLYVACFYPDIAAFPGLLLSRHSQQALRAQGVTPHVAQNTAGRRSAVDGRTTHGPGYAASQKVRRRIEEIFGWMKTVGSFRKTRYRGLERVDFAGYLVAAAYNLVRLVRLTTAPTVA